MVDLLGLRSRRGGKKMYYYLLNKKGFCFYKCDSIEVAIKHYLMDKDIVGKVIKK